MSSLPPSPTPPAVDDSVPALPIADAAPESTSAADSAVESQSVAGAPQQDCGAQLKQLYPALFSTPPKPLKLRIQADIQARSPGVFTKPQLSAFLRRYTGSHAYLNAIVKATHRFDLDGNPGDALSDEHRQAAVDELARRRTNTQARRALEDEQRFNRSVLLRDFEVTKLDKPGFAAMKGVPEGELDGLLELARKEAAEAPPPPARPDRRERPARAPRGDATERGARPDGPRGPRPDTSRAAPGQRPEGHRGPRPDGARGPRPDGQRGPRGDAPRPPRADNARGPRDDRARAPRNDDHRAPRPNVVSSPAAPTAMALAFGAQGLQRTDTPATEPANPSNDKPRK